MSELTDALQKLFDEYGESSFMEGVMSLPYYQQFRADADRYAKAISERRQLEYETRSAQLLQRLKQFNKQP